MCSGRRGDGAIFTTASYDHAATFEILAPKTSLPFETGTIDEPAHGAEVGDRGRQGLKSVSARVFCCCWLGSLKDELTEAPKKGKATEEECRNWQG